MDSRKLALYGGVALIGAGLFVAYSQSQGGGGGSTSGGGSGAGSGGTLIRTSLSDWLKQCVAGPRSDVLSALAAHSWEAVFGQYLIEVWPDFLARADVAPAAQSEQQGEWLKENDPAFWNRADIHAAWFGYPPRKASVIGQYLKEHGAPPQYF